MTAIDRIDLERFVTAQAPCQRGGQAARHQAELEAVVFAGAEGRLVR
jgi:hypothetical protein